MRVLTGSILFTLDGKVTRMHPGDVAHVPAGALHRMDAVDEDASVLEVSTPEVDDVVRVTDDYERT